MAELRLTMVKIRAERLRELQAAEQRLEVVEGVASDYFACLDRGEVANDGEFRAALDLSEPVHSGESEQGEET